MCNLCLHTLVALSVFFNSCKGTVIIHATYILKYWWLIWMFIGSSSIIIRSYKFHPLSIWVEVIWNPKLIFRNHTLSLSHREETFTIHQYLFDLNAICVGGKEGYYIYKTGEWISNGKFGQLLFKHACFYSVYTWSEIKYRPFSPTGTSFWFSWSLILEILL